MFQHARAKGRDGMRTLHTTKILCIILISVFFLAGTPTFAAAPAKVLEPVDSGRTLPLRELPSLPAAAYDHRKLERKMLPNRIGSTEIPELGGVVQDAGVAPSTATVGISFDGVGNRNNVLPPDTNGDISLDYYVQVVNLSFAIYDRNGNTLLGPVSNNTMWSELGGPCEMNNDGDPIVLYDQLADRWLFSQFALPNYPNGPFYQCIAVSQTGDPTGAWYQYAYLISNTKLNDYGKFAVWTDGYYLTINQFSCDFFGCSWAGQGVLAFDRNKMLDGDPNAQAVYFDDPAPNLGGMLPADLDGMTLPPSGTPAIFMQYDDNAWHYTSSDRLWIWNFHVDWINPNNSTFTEAANIGVADVNSDLCGYERNCIPQPGGTAVDAISDRLMFRLQYRNLGSQAAPDQRLVANHTVDVGGDHAGVRWYELSNPGDSWSVRQQGTYAPDSDHRWMGSIAMNGFGDIALGYSVSGENTYPSVRFNGRLGTEAADGEMTQGEGSIVEGGGSQSHYTGRWGDYSMMAVDPTDDCSFWYTQEYYATDGSANWKTRIGSFALTDCGGGGDTIPSVTLTVPLEGSTVSGPVTLTATAMDDNGVAGVEFFVDDSSLGDATLVDNNWVLPWNTTEWMNGSHSVTAVATDTIGQTSSDTNNVIVDNPQPTVHIADLDDISTAAIGRWDATVRITVIDSVGEPVNGAVVTGTWSNGANGNTNCTTGSNGQCEVTKANLKDSVNSVIFTVKSVSGNYDASQNTDPDGDSDGNIIQVCNGDCVEPPPPQTGQFHIGDLEGFTSLGPGNSGKWNADVTVTAHTATEEAAIGVTVIGEWSGAASGTGSCTTGSDGMCTIGKNNLNGSSATFSVIEIQDASGVLDYDKNANHDFDEDTNGTDILLTQPQP
jgi:hypothetical protein